MYDFPPSVSKDVPDGPIREETYDVPPHFVKAASPENKTPGPSTAPEDVYDVPPPTLPGRWPSDGLPHSQEVYDIPASLRPGVSCGRAQDVYDFPRERPAEDGDDYVYDVPPQVVRDAASATGGAEELSVSFKRLSASSTGSARSNLSTSSLDLVPVKESPSCSSSAGVGRLNLELEPAMERLARLQQAVQGSVSSLMSFVSGNWRSAQQMEASLPALRQAVERVKASVGELLEFARGAVANAALAPDRTLQAKLSRQLHKMEEGYQGLLQHSQSLDGTGWALGALLAPPPGGDDLDRLVMCSRGVPDDTKQLASFLHGNATLLFRKAKHQPVEAPGNNNNVSAYQTGLPERTNIQSRPLPSPPKFTTEEESQERPYDTTEEGWMEDYDYVHLQVSLLSHGRWHRKW